MINELRQLETLGYVRAVNHQTLPLIVWNYTPVVQFEKKWSEYPLLRSCRGLVTDLEGNIAGRVLINTSTGKSIIFQNFLILRVRLK